VRAVLRASKDEWGDMMLLTIILRGSLHVRLAPQDDEH
jgi:hypothetical protein